MEGFEEYEEQRTNAYKDRLETYLRNWLVELYPERAEQFWSRDYSSVEAFTHSVEPNREGWRRVLNPPDLTPQDALERQPHPPLEHLEGEWVSLSFGPFAWGGALVTPRDAAKPVPLVIAQHGIGSTPEKIFGVHDPTDGYHAYGKALVEAGFAVFAPMNLRSGERRTYIENLCRLAGTSLPGIELVCIQRLLDHVLADPRLDAENVGMWGVSLGGMATMFYMPLEPRIKAGIPSAWFNHRRKKMAAGPGETYSTFQTCEGHHAYFMGWLTAFTDADVMSLICPRPFLVQHGKQDGIAHWPGVVEEYKAAKQHYEKLGLADRFLLDLHEGGHEPRLETGIPFLRQWLMAK
ncbi:MAG: hypothetical protein R6V12_06580 [Candidatus Hydrogenedentota bacterium]